MSSNKIGWNFDNTYSKLPKSMLSKLSPNPVKHPEIIIINQNLSKELSLNFSGIENEELASIFSGNLLPDGSGISPARFQVFLPSLLIRFP